MKSYIREQRHVCGRTEDEARYQEVDLFPVTATQHKASSRAKKKLASTVAQMNLNEKKSNRHFSLIAHTNFSEGDRHVVLGYSPENLPETLAEAEHQLDLWVGRINYLCKKLGHPSAKLLGVTEQSGKRTTRYHHHIIIKCNLTDKQLRDLWSTGRGSNRRRIGWARVDDLDFEGFGGTINGLCAYLMKCPEGKRRWKQSKGLIQPKRPRPNDGKYSRAALAKICKERLDDTAFWQQKYPGWELVEPAIAAYNDYAGWHLCTRLKRLPQPRARPQKKIHRKGEST